jgi:hypothetical protein
LNGALVSISARPAATTPPSTSIDRRSQPLASARPINLQ